MWLRGGLEPGQSQEWGHSHECPATGAPGGKVLGPLSQLGLQSRAPFLSVPGIVKPTMCKPNAHLLPNQLLLQRSQFQGPVPQFLRMLKPQSLMSPSCVPHPFPSTTYPSLYPVDPGA